jgi:hypothetical protein
VNAFRVDGATGELRGQENVPGELDAGIYAHQVRVDPSNRSANVVARGNPPAGDKKENPGGLKVHRYQDGVLVNPGSVAPGGGLTFSRGIWIFIRGNHGCMYRRSGRIRFRCTARGAMGLQGAAAPGPGKFAHTEYRHTRILAADVCAGSEWEAAGGGETRFRWR